MVPPHAHHLFWDTPLETFEPAEFPAYTIARALEHGTERDVAWVRDLLGDDAVRDVLRSDARLSRRSAHFWALCLGVPRDRVAALAPSPGHGTDPVSGARRAR
jgi:hypothetical protein